MLNHNRLYIECHHVFCNIACFRCSECMCVYSLVLGDIFMYAWLCTHVTNVSACRHLNQQLTVQYIFMYACLCAHVIYLSSRTQLNQQLKVQVYNGGAAGTSWARLLQGGSVSFEEQLEQAASPMHHSSSGKLVPMPCPFPLPCPAPNLALPCPSHHHLLSSWTHSPTTPHACLAVMSIPFLASIGQ